MAEKDSNEKTIIINKDNLEKSLELLGLKSSEYISTEENPFNKGKENEKSPEDIAAELKKADDEAAEAEEVEKAKKLADIMKKAEEEAEEMEDDEEKEGDDDVVKAKKAVSKKIKLEKAKKQTEKAIIDSADSKKLEELQNKSLEGLDLIKGLMDENISQVTSIKEEIMKGFESMISRFTALGTLEKAILEQNTDLSRRLTEMENLPMGGRKSATTKNYIEKSFDQNDLGQQQGVKKLSRVSDKKEIIEILSNKANMNDMEKVNQPYMEALLKYEASSVLEKGVIADLFKTEKVLIID